MSQKKEIKRKGDTNETSINVKRLSGIINNGPFKRCTQNYSVQKQVPADIQVHKKLPYKFQNKNMKF